MPTGYTCDVSDGKITTLRDFALRCARAFGALITMRDEPFDAPIPEKFEPRTDYHDKAIREAREQLEKLTSMSPAQVTAAAKKDADKIAAGYAASDADRLARENRYKAMLAQVVQWEVPAEITDLRSFMIEQLQESIRFDCGDMSKYRDKPIPAEQWLERRREGLLRDIAYHQESRAKEIQRTAERNAWLSALRSSLPGPQP